VGLYLFRDGSPADLRRWSGTVDGSFNRYMPALPANSSFAWAVPADLQTSTGYALRAADERPAASRQPVSPGRIVAVMKTEIERYLSTGDSDPLMTNWPGNNVLERLKRGDKRLRAALLAEVRRRAARVRMPTPENLPVDLVAFARTKLEPMVLGLFPQVEQPPVLALLERSVAFLTPETIEPLIRGAGFLETAWAVANIYQLSSLSGGWLGSVYRSPHESRCPPMARQRSASGAPADPTGLGGDITLRRRSRMSGARNFAVSSAMTR